MASEAAVARLRDDLGDTNPQEAFSDAELANLLDYRGGDALAALVDGLWQLTTQAARLTAYTVGLSQERKDEVFDHLLALHKVKAAELARAGAQAAAEARAAQQSSSVAVPTQLVW